MTHMTCPVPAVWRASDLVVGRLLPVEATFVAPEVVLRMLRGALHTLPLWHSVDLSQALCRFSGNSRPVVALDHLGSLLNNGVAVTTLLLQDFAR